MKLGAKSRIMKLVKDVPWLEGCTLWFLQKSTDINAIFTVVSRGFFFSL